MGGAVILDHISITVDDLTAAAPFHDAVMAALGAPCVWRERDGDRIEAVCHRPEP